MESNRDNTNVTDEQVKAILEGAQVRYLGDGKIELTKGSNKCVRKIHNFPEYQRGQE